MAKHADPVHAEPVTRNDLERGFRNLQLGVRKQVDDRRSTLLAIVGGIGLTIVVVIFLVGRRSGKKQTTYVEIRRV